MAEERKQSSSVSGQGTDISMASKTHAGRADLGGLSYTPLHRPLAKPAGAGGGLPSPAGEHRRPPAFVSWHSGVIFFWALVDLCDLGNMDTCKRGERERERLDCI